VIFCVWQGYRRIFFVLRAQLHRYHQSVRQVFRNPELLRLASLIFQHRAIPLSSITFARGSGQDLHQDMAVFHVYPRSFLLGCWIACEDIAPGSGPLIYCPGSHRSEWFPEFNNYPQTNLRTCAWDTTQRYHDWISRQSARFEQKRFLARKGDVLFWHSMLFHGGEPIQRADSTRKTALFSGSLCGILGNCAVFEISARYFQKQHRIPRNSAVI
jgi:phytanoyl-CoA hydroxylase